MLSALLRPEFLVGAGVIVFGAAIAWYFIVGRQGDLLFGGSPDGSQDGSSNRSPHRSGEPPVGPDGQRLPVLAGSSPPPRAADRDGDEEIGDGPGWPQVTFADVAGLDHAVEELRELREYLTDPMRFEAVGARLPRGVLLHGPPGNGKTLLARALAGESQVPFHAVSAAGFVEQYVGVGAARIRDLFKEAKKNTPSIVFIDELDAVGRRRSTGEDGMREFDHTLNQLLVELDGSEEGQGVLILGATNRPELLDSALVRPGRFDRRIEVPLPDLQGRKAVLELHAAHRPVTGTVDWGEVARETTGLSAAELAGIVNEAALLAARHHQRLLTPEHVREAVDRVRHGTQRSRLLSDDDKHRLAVHEAGHAVLAVRLRDVQLPGRVTIVTRADSHRSPWRSPADREVVTKQELMAQLIALLGGRAAEQLLLGEPSTRAEDDLRDAAELARRMVARWAMTGRYELAGREETDSSASGEGVREMLTKAERAATVILEDHRTALDLVRETLMQRETLTADEVQTLVDRARGKTDGSSDGADRGASAPDSSTNGGRPSLSAKLRG